MASRIKAIHAGLPRLKLGRRICLDELIDFITRQTQLSEGTIRCVLIELRDALVYFCRWGHPVHLGGLGTYTPTIDLTGVIGIGYRTDAVLKRRLNAKQAFLGTIENGRNLGKTAGELVAQWNENHTDDPVI